MIRHPRASSRLALLGTFLLLVCGLSPARAGNPIQVDTESGPVTWENGTVPFNTDLGPLGILDNATAVRMVRDGFAAWQAVPSASIDAVDQGPILVDGLPADVTFENFMRVLFVQDQQSPVIFDHDGRIMDALGVGDFAGFSFPEFQTQDGAHFTERAILLDGRDVDADGPFTPVGWSGLVNHEIGHHLGLGHSVVNGQAFFFGDDIIGLGRPPESSLETMYPLLLTDAIFQASPHRDDIGTLSVLYPVATFRESTATVRGTITAPDLETPLRGANVTARSLASPFDEAVSSISGAFPALPGGLPAPSPGFYTLEGLTPDLSYSVAVSNITFGGFSSLILNPLPGPDEFYNGANESNDSDRDVPTDFTPIVPPAGGLVDGIDIIMNGPASVRILDDPDALAPPDDATVSGFAVPPEIDIRRVEARFQDTDGDGAQETLSVLMDVVGPLGAMNSEFRFHLDFTESQKVRRDFLSLEDQTVEPGTRGVSTADVTLELMFRHAGAVFSGLPGLAARSRFDPATGRIEFVASVEEVFAAVTQAQIDAANNFDGTFTLLGFSSASLRHSTDRVPDTNDNDDPSIVQETSRFTFFPFPIVPTHLGSVPNGTLIALEETTGRALRIGSIGVTSFSDLALSEDGRLFGSLGFGGNGRIVQIDPATATRTDIGLSGFEAVPALDFAPSGTAFAGALFGVGRVSDPTAEFGVRDFLIRIDTATGQGTRVSSQSTGVPFVDSIVFADDGRLFGAGFMDNQGVLIELDPATGSTTRIIGPIGPSVVGLEVASEGFLIGSVGGFDAQAGGIVRIDPANGASTFIGFTGFSPVSGLTKLR